MWKSLDEEATRLVPPFPFTFWTFSIKIMFPIGTSIFIVDTLVYAGIVINCLGTNVSTLIFGRVK